MTRLVDFGVAAVATPGVCGSGELSALGVGALHDKSERGKFGHPIGIAIEAASRSNGVASF